MTVKTLNNGDFMKHLLIVIALLASTTVHAREILKADCVGKKGKITRKLSIKGKMISNGEKNDLKWIEVDGDNQKASRDVSQIPAYTGSGNAEITIQYGADLTSVARLSLKSCESETEATGRATLNEQGRITELACGCTLE